MPTRRPRGCSASRSTGAAGRRSSRWRSARGGWPRARRRVPTCRESPRRRRRRPGRTGPAAGGSQRHALADGHIGRRGRILGGVRASLGIPIAIAAVVVALLWWFGTRDPYAAERARLLDAIRMVESSDRPDPPDGDGGLAIGPYQIHRVYWLDAVEAEPSLGGRYEDCRRRGYAERVIAAYMRRYVPEAWEAADAEVVARTHNGGPQG